MKRKYMTIVTMLSAISLAACGQTTTTSVSNSTANAQTENSTATDEKPSSDDDASGVNADTDQDRVADKDNNDEEDATSGEETTITVQDGSIKTKGDGVEVDGSTITITEAGTYRFSGTIEDGKIVIDAKKKEVVVINGGTLKINADGDGIDSNGDLTINGGSIIVYGPENSGNSAIDYNGTGVITGGEILTTGMSGRMADTFSEGSTQSYIVYYTTSTEDAGTSIEIVDADGNTIYEDDGTEKKFNMVIYSSDDLKTGNTYTVKVGDSSESVEISDIESTIGTASQDTMGGGMRNHFN